MFENTRYTTTMPCPLGDSLNFHVCFHVVCHSKIHWIFQSQLKQKNKQTDKRSKSFHFRKYNNQLINFLSTDKSMNQLIISAQCVQPNNVVFAVGVLIYFHLLEFHLKHVQRAEQWNVTLFCYLWQPINFIHSPPTQSHMDKHTNIPTQRHTLTT